MEKPTSSEKLKLLAEKMKASHKHSLLFLVLLLLMLWLPLTQAQEAQETPQRAGLVVMLADGKVERRCVAFTEPSISGYDLLLRSGLAVNVEVTAIGAMVCTIEDTGCPASDCLCQCRGGTSCVYWSYWHLQPEGWQYSRAGANVSRVTEGVVEGWVWGPGSVSSAPPPPLYTFEEICGAAAVSETAPAGSATAAAGDRTGSYLVFGLIVAGLAAAWLALRRREPGEME
jgi:hypothetical protein